MSKVPDQTYDDVVIKARTLFWTKGYQDIKVNDLTECLEISPSLFYKKYSKDMLLIDSLDSYVCNISNPVLSQIQNSENGIETFRDFFYGLIDALITKTFPRSCLMVNTVVEMHNHQERLELTDVYNRYFGNMKTTYISILKRAAEKGDIKHPDKIEKYAEFLVGIIFGMGILYKVKSKEELRLHIDQQLAIIV